LDFLHILRASHGEDDLILIGVNLNPLVSEHETKELPTFDVENNF